MWILLAYWLPTLGGKGRGDMDKKEEDGGGDGCYYEYCGWDAEVDEVRSLNLFTANEDIFRCTGDLWSPQSAVFRCVEVSSRF